MLIFLHNFRFPLVAFLFHLTFILCYFCSCHSVNLFRLEYVALVRTLAFSLGYLLHFFSFSHFSPIFSILFPFFSPVHLLLSHLFHEVMKWEIKEIKAGIDWEVLVPSLSSHFRSCFWEQKKKTLRFSTQSLLISYFFLFNSWCHAGWKFFTLG